jgi:hypothetical protein
MVADAGQGLRTRPCPRRIRSHRANRDVAEARLPPITCVLSVGDVDCRRVRDDRATPGGDRRLGQHRNGSALQTAALGLEASAEGLDWLQLAPRSMSRRWGGGPPKRSDLRGCGRIRTCDRRLVSTIGLKAVLTSISAGHREALCPLLSSRRTITYDPFGPWSAQSATAGLLGGAAWSLKLCGSRSPFDRPRNTSP